MGGLLRDALSARGVTDDSEEFLSLEDTSSEKPEVKQRTPRKLLSKNLKPLSDSIVPDDTESMDMLVVGEYGGNQSISWPIQDMDCPHCASEAMSALNRLDQVTTSLVSATDGTVTIDIDFEKGHISEASAVLRSLGNPPDIPFMQISGVKSSSIAARHSVPVKALPRIFRRQPGVLDCDVDREGNLKLQLVPNLNTELQIAMDESLKDVVGSDFNLIPEKINTVTSGQWRMIGSGIAFVMLVILLLTKYLVTDNPWIIGAIGISGVLLGGVKMFSKAWASVNNNQFGFQVLTSLAVIGASYLQAWEEALMVLILVAWTEHMENEALVTARKAMQGGLDRLPRTARRVPKTKLDKFSMGSISLLSEPNTMAPLANNKSEVEEIPIGLVMRGDHLEIRSGELIPADGNIISGAGSVNKAPLTGESVPVDVKPGDELQAGLTLARGPVTIEVTAVGEDTRLSGLIDKVHTYKNVPTRLQGVLENFTALWVPVVLIGAVFAWLLIPGADWKIVLLLWVVACPCALLLATPVPHAASLSLASKSGAIARGGDVMEALSKVNLVLLDKTGTLTSGKPILGTIALAKGRRRETAIAIAAGLESSSNHPYAEAVLRLAQEESITPKDLTEHSDTENGVFAKMKGSEVSFTRAETSQVSGKLLTELEDALSKGHGASLLMKDGKQVALFTFVHDDLRDGTDELIKSLHANGVNVEILSGDNQESVTKIARRIGVPKNAAKGGMTPENKVRWVENRSKTHITMMVGDGFNDAAAMAAADVGIAIGTGESANLEAADVLIPGDDPRLISELVTLARRTRAILVWNIGYSVAITIFLVYLVLADLNNSLAFGVLVHELSVIGVIINGARLSGTGGTLKLIIDTFTSIWKGTIESFKSLYDSI